MKKILLSSIFSLDLSKPVELEIEKWKEDYEEILKPYRVV